MKRFLHLAVFFLFALSLAYGQSREPSVSRSPEEGLIAKNRSENVLYSGDDFTLYNVYPNPADEFIQIKYSIPSHITNLKFVLSSVLGNQVFSNNLPPDNSDSNRTEGIKVNISHLSPGIYFYTFYLGSKTLIGKKLVVKR